MDDEKLIELVRKHPELYDMTNKKYMDPKFKMSIWASIGIELNETGNACKTRWTNIRDQFKKSLNRRQQKSGQAAVKIRKYKYDDFLQFMIVHLSDRDVIENIANDSESATALNDSQRISQDDTQTTSQNDTQATSQNDTQATSQNDTQATSQNDTQTTSQNDTQTTSQNDTQTTSQNDTQTVSRGQRTATVKKSRPQAQASTSQKSRPQAQASTSQTSASASLMKYIIENKTKPEEMDHIEAFFKGLIPTIKRFSPYYQHLAKSKIFQAVENLEWQWLSADPLSSESLTMSTPTPPPAPLLLPLQEDTLPQQEDTFPQQEDTLPQQEDTFPQQEDTLPQQEGTLQDSDTSDITRFFIGFDPSNINRFPPPP